MGDGNGPGWPPRDRHVNRFGRCVSCGAPTERHERLPGTYPPCDYDWCLRCGMAMWCACEGCGVLRALARL